MFRRLYAKKLKTGDLTRMAVVAGKSEEWYSRLTRYGGSPCPAEVYWKWYCLIYQVNPTAANALHESLNTAVEQFRLDNTEGTWNPQQTAACLLTQAAKTVNRLNDVSVTADDEPALLDLQMLVQEAIEKCRMQSKAPVLKEARRN